MLTENDPGSKPCKDRLQGKEHCCMRGGKELLRPALDRKSRCCRQHGCHDQGDHDARAPVNVRPLKYGQADGHKNGGEAHLQQRQLLEAHPERKMRQRQHMAGESESAGQREEISGIDRPEIEARVGGRCEQNNPQKGEQGS